VTEKKKKSCFITSQLPSTFNLYSTFSSSSENKNKFQIAQGNNEVEAQFFRERLLDKVLESAHFHYFSSFEKIYLFMKTQEI